MTDTVTDAILGYVRTDLAGDRPDLELTADTDLLAEGVIDSLGIFMLISFLEQTYAIEVPPDDVLIENFRRPADIAGLVAKRAAVGSAAGTGERAG